MTDTNVPCGIDFFSLPFNISSAWFVILLFLVSFVVGFIASIWLNRTFRIARVEIVYQFYKRDGWSGLCKIAKELWCYLCVVTTFVGIIVCTVCIMLLKFKEYVSLIYPECAHWTVLVLSVSLGLICSFALFFILLLITRRLHNPATVVPVDNENHGMTLSPVQPSVQQHAVQQAQGPAVAHGMTRRSRRSPTRAASALGQQDQEPRAEERPRSQTEGSQHLRRS